MKYYLCKVGSFNGGGEEEIINDCLRRNVYQYHEATRQKGAGHRIGAEDTLILVYKKQILAYGIVSGGGMTTADGYEQGWLAVPVKQWIRVDNGEIFPLPYGVFWHTLVGNKQSVVKEIDAQWANEIIRQIIMRNRREMNISNPPVCIRNVFPAMKLMKWNLRVPDYQRSYCWEKQNVLGLLNDIAKWQAKHEGQLYHIGTIVLKKYDKDKDEYDIIDGQQRLITLALTLSAKKKPPVIPQISLGQTNADNSAKYHLRQAKNTIDNWQGEIDFDHLCMSVIIIGKNESEDLAFLFFNHLNSSGKRLDDYDLLKSHHLRYLADDIAGLMAKKWDELDKAAKRELLHLVLYRLRNWMDGNNSFPYNADILENHELFRNFTLDYEPMSGLCTPYQPYRLNSILASGLEFFNYTEQYKHRLQEFKGIPCVQALSVKLSGHSHGTLYFGIFALSFLFYCKFGEFYLKEAIYAIIYNVSELRNETAIHRGYIAKRPVFSVLTHLIDKATHEGEFLGKALDDNATYFITNRGTTASVYWHAVGALCSEQKFTDSPHIASHVIKFIADCNKKAEDQ